MPDCPAKMPLAGKNLDGLADRVNVVVVYTIEAHPEGDPHPYGGRTDTPMVNMCSGIVYGQPKTLSKRMELMKEFIEHTATTYPVWADGMGNLAWEALGSGPNLAGLVDTNGTVLVKQGWLNTDTIRGEIEQWPAKKQ